jgi:hypothetical protein
MCRGTIDDDGAAYLSCRAASLEDRGVSQAPGSPTASAAPLPRWNLSMIRSVPSALPIGLRAALLQTRHDLPH